MTQQDADRMRIRNEQDRNRETERHNRAQEALAPIEAGISAGGRYAAAKSGNRKPDNGIRRNINLVYHLGDKNQGNHPSWYTNFEDAQYFGLHSYSDVAGKTLRGLTANGGLMVLYYAPNIYTESDGRNGSRAINKALLAVQQFVRQENSGAKNYEPSDIALAMIAFNEVLAQYYELAKIYGLLQTKDPASFWTKEYLVPALTTQSYKQVSTQHAEIYFALKNARSLLTKLPLPKVPLFERTRYLAMNVWYDEPLKRSKVIVAQRNMFGTYYPAGTLKNVGASVRMRPVVGAAQAGAPNIATGFITSTITGRITALMEAIDALTNMTEFVTIMGDIAKAYGYSEIVEEIPEEYETKPIYDPVMLTQINNTVLVGSPIWPVVTTITTAGSASFYDVVDVDGFLVQGWVTSNAGIGQTIYSAPIYQTANSSAQLPFQVAIDSPVENPSADDVFVLTRNAAITDSVRAPQTVDYPELGSSSSSSFTQVGAWMVEGSATYYNYNKAISAVVKSRGFSSNQAPSCIPLLTAGTEVFCTADVVILDSDNIYKGISFATLYGLNSLSAAYEHAPLRIESFGGPITGSIVASVLNNAVPFDLPELERLNYAATFSEFTAVKVGSRTNFKRGK